MMHFNGLQGGWISSPRFAAGRRQVHCLGSFGFGATAPKRPGCVGKFFMDSGAFSVWKSGKTIEVRSYISFLREHLSVIDVYAALDVIGDAEASFRNYVVMREAGLDPMPCLHIGEPLSWLEKYVEAGATYIGLGGIAQRAAGDRHQFLREVFQRFPDPAKVGFHGFGIASPAMWRQYPFRSCDSTTAAMAGASRTVKTPFGILEFRTRTAKRRLPGAVDERLRAWVESVGGSSEIAALPHAEGGYECAYLTAIALDGIAAATPPFTYKPILQGFHL